MLIRGENPPPPGLEGLSVSTESRVGGVMVSLVVPLAPTPEVSRLVPRLFPGVAVISFDLNGVAKVSEIFTLSPPAPRLC